MHSSHDYYDCFYCYHEIKRFQSLLVSKLRNMLTTMLWNLIPECLYALETRILVFCARKDNLWWRNLFKTGHQDVGNSFRKLCATVNSWTQFSFYVLNYFISNLPVIRIIIPKHNIGFKINNGEILNVLMKIQCIYIISR